MILVLVLFLLISLAMLVLAGVFIPSTHPTQSARWAVIVLTGAVFLAALLGLLGVLPGVR